MQIILLEQSKKLGKLGDVVTVKPGYARNFLLPQGKLYVRTKTIWKSSKLNGQSAKHATQMQKLLPKVKPNL